MTDITLQNILNTSQMTYSGATFSDGIFTFPAMVFCMINQSLPTPIPGHLYYGRVDQKVPANTDFADGRFEYYVTDAGGTGNIVFTSFFNAIQDNQWHSYSSIQSFTGLYAQTGYILRSFTVNGTNTVYRKNGLIVDLTSAFGSGNEPTAEWCDDHIPFFEGTYTINSNMSIIHKKTAAGYDTIYPKTSAVQVTMTSGSNAESEIQSLRTICG